MIVCDLPTVQGESVSRPCMTYAYDLEAAGMWQSATNTSVKIASDKQQQLI
jgi:hypothetical protein